MFSFVYNYLKIGIWCFSVCHVVPLCFYSSLEQTYHWLNRLNKMVWVRVFNCLCCAGENDINAMLLFFRIYSKYFSLLECADYPTADIIYRILILLKQFSDFSCCTCFSTHLFSSVFGLPKSLPLVVPKEMLLQTLRGFIRCTLAFLKLCLSGSDVDFYNHLLWQCQFVFYCFKILEFYFTKFKVPLERK